MGVLKQWAVGVVVFVVVDYVWIGLIANAFYRRALGPLLRMDGDRLAPRLAPALLLYTLMVAGLLLFALPKARGEGLALTMGWSAAFGLIAYAVYDLTNYATLEAFPLRVVAVDMAWGGLACALTGAAMWAVRPV